MIRGEALKVVRQLAEQHQLVLTYEPSHGQVTVAAVVWRLAEESKLVSEGQSGCQAKKMLVGSSGGSQ